jgi:hypothetical protein
MLFIELIAKLLFCEKSGYIRRGGLTTLEIGSIDRLRRVRYFEFDGFSL